MNKIKGTMWKTTWLLASLTVLSRVAGLVRDRLLAGDLGAGKQLDIYYASFRLPDLVFNLLILGTLTVAFLPVFSKKLEQSKDSANTLARTLMLSAVGGILVLCLIVWLMVPSLIPVLVPGFDRDARNLTVELTRIMLLSPVLFTFSSIITAILNTYRKFFWAGLAPVFYNAGIIFGIIFLYPNFGLKGLAVGVLIGAVLHAGVQLPDLWLSGFRFLGKLEFGKDLMKVGLLFLPKVIGVDSQQFTLLVYSFFGSYLTAGSISVLTLSSNIEAVPLGVFAVSGAIAVFPLLSQAVAKENFGNFLGYLESSLDQMFLFLLPATVWMLLLRAQTVRLLLGTGHFDWAATTRTFECLGILTLSLFAQGMVPLLARAFYALQNTWIPALIGIITITINFFIAFILVKPLGVIGLAIGFSGSVIINAVILFITFFIYLRQQVPGMHSQLTNFVYRLQQSVFRLLTFSIASGTGLYGTLYILDFVFDTHTWVGLALQVFGACLVGLTIYIGAIYLNAKFDPGQSRIYLKFQSIVSRFRVPS